MFFFSRQRVGLARCIRTRNRTRPERYRAGPAPIPLLRAASAWHEAARTGAVMAEFKQRVFSGVQPTGNLHLGNYLGAIKRFVELQAKFDCIYCVVDMHAITVWQYPDELAK